MNIDKTLSKQLLQDCDKGYKGNCCCNCKFQVKINKHPINPDFAKGSIEETFGYGCEVFRFFEGGSNDNQIIFSKSIHGMFLTKPYLNKPKPTATRHTASRLTKP